VYQQQFYQAPSKLLFSQHSAHYHFPVISEIRVAFHAGSLLSIALGCDSGEMELAVSVSVNLTHCAFFVLKNLVVPLLFVRMFRIVSAGST